MPQGGLSRGLPGVPPGTVSGTNMRPLGIKSWSEAEIELDLDLETELELQLETEPEPVLGIQD